VTDFSCGLTSNSVDRLPVLSQRDRAVNGPRAPKRVGIMQPYLFAYLGYYQLIKAVDEYIVYDDVQYKKGGWINRNYLLMNGQRSMFTVRLRGASPNLIINQIEMADNFSRFIKTIASAYGRAPQYKPVQRLLSTICDFPSTNLALFVDNSLKEIANYLGIDTSFTCSSTLKKDNSLRGQEKILEICAQREASEYINAIGGRVLYDPDEFAKHNIRLKFLKPNLSSYRQFNNEFVPSLSIIDVLMFNSIETANEMLDDYELL
jgi:hypothetical protein